MLFLTEDQITDIFSEYLSSNGYEIISRAKGQLPGADIVATINNEILYIEAKGGGSQSPHTRRFGKPFTKLQCQKHTDAAFACIPRMIARYSPNYVGIALPDDLDHNASLSEILPAIKKLGAGAWVVGNNGIKCLAKPKLQKYPANNQISKLR